MSKKKSKINKNSAIGQSTSQSLVISATPKKVLTKNQQAFNKLSLRIEKLHKDIEKKQSQFDLALKIYGNEIYPIINRLSGHSRKLVTVLWDIFKSYKLSKSDQRNLKQIIKDHVTELCTDLDEAPDKDLSDIYKALNGETYEKMKQREEEGELEDIQSFFEQMEMDTTDLDMNDREAVMEKVKEAQIKLKEDAEAAQASAATNTNTKKKKKSTKQEVHEKLQKESAEMKQKNISTIYKQLAKLFHPDLEQDEERKAGKEILMRELIAAYESKNLHTLLMLELKWIHNENDHLETLSEEKLSIYLEILREQAGSLQNDMYNICRQSRYVILTQRFGHSVQNFPLEVVNNELKKVKDIEKGLQKEIAEFQTPNALRSVKQMITSWKQAQRYSFDMDDFMM